MHLGPPEIVGIILARMDSSRLPGKALLRVNDKPLVGYCIDRALKIRGLRNVVLATTDRMVDEPLVEYANSIGLPVYRGESDNVAKRCLDCAKAFGGDYFLRMNGDSPFVDPSVVGKAIDILEDQRPDLVTNLLERTYPYGVAVELVRVKTLEELVGQLTLAQAEHVTAVFYERRHLFELKSISGSFLDYSKCRMVVDDTDDFRLFEKVVAALGAGITDSGYEVVANTYLAIKDGKSGPIG